MSRWIFDLPCLHHDHVELDKTLHNRHAPNSGATVLFVNSAKPITKYEQWNEEVTEWLDLKELRQNVTKVTSRSIGAYGWEL